MSTTDTGTANVRVQARIEPELKSKGDAVLEQLGMDPSTFVRMAYKQLVVQQGIPFELRVPNAKTVAALNENMTVAKRYINVSSMTEDIFNSDD